MAQLDQDLFKEIYQHYFYNSVPSHVHLENNMLAKWEVESLKEREKFGLVCRRSYYGMCSLLSEFSSIKFYVKEQPNGNVKEARTSFRKLPALKTYKKLRSLEEFTSDGSAKGGDEEVLVTPKFVKFFTKIFPEKKWFLDLSDLNDILAANLSVAQAIETLENLFYISITHYVPQNYYDRLRALFKKNLMTLKHFDGISGIDYSRIIPNEAQFETCYIQCRPTDASDKPTLPQLKTKTFLLGGTTLTGFLFQQSTAEKFVIESSGFKRFFDKFASYLSLAAQSMEMESISNKNLKSIVLNIDQWCKDDVPYFGMFLKEISNYFPSLEKLHVKVNFMSRVYGSNWHFLIINTRGLASFENYFNEWKRLVELYWYEMMKFDRIPFKIDFDAKFHYESLYEKVPLPDFPTMQRLFFNWDVQPIDPSTVQVIKEKYPGTPKSATSIKRHFKSNNFDFNISVKVVSLDPSNVVWNQIKKGLKDVFYDCKDRKKIYIETYTFCYEFLTFGGIERTLKYSSDCHNTVGLVMYENVRRFITEKVEEILRSIRYLQGDSLLEAYADRWRRFEYGADLTNGIFSYLNRHWIKRNIEDRVENIHEIAHLAKIIWRRHLFEHVRESLETSILNKAKTSETTNFELIYKQIDEIFGFDSIGFDQIVIQAAIEFVLKNLQYSNVNTIFKEVGQLLSNRINNLDNLFMFCLRSLVAKGYLKQIEDEEEGLMISFA